MKKISAVLFIFIVIGFVFISFKNTDTKNPYLLKYKEQINKFQNQEKELLQLIKNSDLSTKKTKELLKSKIDQSRIALKNVDIWLRYLEPIAYKKINGPLPVEWETEVFEKFEKPYKRYGAGLTLAALYLEEEKIKATELSNLIQESITASEIYTSDSITTILTSPDHFFLCNRLFLLNLSAIYTTGFECPDTLQIIPELRSMLNDVYLTYQQFNEQFDETKLHKEYLDLFKAAIDYVKNQPGSYSQFDHFTFIKNYVNPLFSFNQDFIRKYHVSSRSYVDYSLNKTSTSIFSKNLYQGQSTKGVFLRVTDEDVLARIDKVGKLLFYDPILSGNNKRSCVSCHQATTFLTDTVNATSLQYDQSERLERNTPSLLNVPYNHLLMLDGKHISMKDQAMAVITCPKEMGANADEVLKKVLSCKEYKKTFTSLLKYTPQEKEITMEHITSALSFYYSKFSKYDASFDEAMNTTKELDPLAKEGFNVFMSKAQCATCHFVPQFNGVKPPYVGSEFEVLGVPQDTTYKKISKDKGRYEVNAAKETAHAFRTATIRNVEKTKPYMHNGVFTTLEQVLDFYDAGGGTGKGLRVENQTLSGDSLHLSMDEKKQLLAFIASLTERVDLETAPTQLPESSIAILNKRKVGGTY